MQKKLLISAMVALILIGVVVFVWEKKPSQEASQNEVKEEVGKGLEMSLKPNGNKNYRSEEYGFEVTVPKEWVSFRDVKIEKREDGSIALGFLFETQDSRYFNEYDCQGKCIPMFYVHVITHDEFNAEFIEQFISPGNLVGKGPAIAVNNKYVFSGGSMGYFSSDPPSDLVFLKSELTKFYRLFKVFDVSRATQ